MFSNVQVILPAGMLDSANGNRLRREVLDAVESHSKHILLDCRNVEFMDSSGLGALVMALKTVREAGSKLSLCSINEQPRILLELTSMDSVFEIFADQNEFCQAIAAA